MPPKAILRISFNCQSFGLSTHSPDECVKAEDVKRRLNEAETIIKEHQK